MESQGVKTDFVKVEKGITRINIKISSMSENKVEETALNGMGTTNYKKRYRSII